MDNYNCPIGSDTSEAPWNQVNNPEKEIEVSVSITLSKSIKIKVSDYEITDSGKDEDGEYSESIDFSNCDLKRTVENQIILPHEAYKSMMVNTEKSKRAYNDLKGWNVDDFEVVLE